MLQLEEMGCRGSKSATKSESPSQNSNALPPEAAEFMKLVNTEGHPVARKTLEEWSVFVDAHTRRRQGDSSGLHAFQSRDKEPWANTQTNPVTHPSVDGVGKAFLKYLKNDLLLRSWGGDFDYEVAGVATQGYLRVAAKLDLGPIDSSSATDEQVWEIRIHYHSCS